MSDEAQELLMMFIRDGYSSSGKVSKATAVKMINFVSANPGLQNLVNIGDSKSILKFRIDSPQ